MELRTILVADYANISEGGKLNVMGIFGQICADICPARHSDMYFIAALIASPAEFEKKRTITVNLMNADASQRLVAFSQQIEVPAAKGGRKAEINFIVRLRDIIFPEFGPYQFSILVDDDEKGTLPIEVNKVDPKQP